LEAAGHSYLISDLYKMGFRTDMTESEYLREANYDDDAPLPDDVIAEQNKINASNAIVFIYPVFWTEAPAKLVGWFDRVWTYGFAYGDESIGMKQLDKGLVICVAGRSLYHLTHYGHLDAMKTVMLGDRLCDRVKYKDFIVLDGMSKYAMIAREANWDRNLDIAYEAGFTLEYLGQSMRITKKQLLWNGVNLALKIIDKEPNKIVVVNSDTPIICDGQSALDFTLYIGYDHNCQRIVVNKAAISEDFFRLSTGVAGEVGQKLVNYGVRLAIVGDFSGYTSKPLHDYIYECNKGNHLYFTSDENEAVKMIGR